MWLRASSGSQAGRGSGCPGSGLMGQTAAASENMWEVLRGAGGPSLSER